MDAALTLAVALHAEERAARRGGARVARVGLGSRLPLPGGRLVAFGLAGALAPDLEPGMLVTATRIVDERGVVLWEGDPVLAGAARPVVLAVTDRVVDDADERRALAERTGAHAVDMESGRLAASGRLAGAVRAISDTPATRVGALAHAAHGDGTTDWRVVLRAFATEPVRSTRTARAARRAFASLEHAARGMR